MLINRDHKLESIKERKAKKIGILKLGIIKLGQWILK